MFMVWTWGFWVLVASYMAYKRIWGSAALAVLLAAVFFYADLRIAGLR